MLKRIAVALVVLTMLLLAGASAYLFVEVDDLRGEIESVRQANRRSNTATAGVILSLLPDPNEARQMGSDISDLQTDIREIKSCLSSLGIAPTAYRSDWILAQVSRALTCRAS